MIYDMILYDIIWYDMIWYDPIWYYMILYDSPIFNQKNDIGMYGYPFMQT